MTQYSAVMWVEGSFLGFTILAHVLLFYARRGLKRQQRLGTISVKERLVRLAHYRRAEQYSQILGLGGLLFIALCVFLEKSMWWGAVAGFVLAEFYRWYSRRKT